MSGEVARPYEELRAHGHALLDAAAAAGAALRLMGGIAIRERSRDLGGLPADARAYHDIDLVGLVRQVRIVDRVFLELGYQPDAAVNTQFGTTRRVYYHREGWHADLFLDRLEFCHTIDLNGRLELAPATLAPADLLLQKLQIVKRDRKDVVDVYWLLLNHAPVRGDPAALDLDRVTAVTRDDWGFQATATDFLDAAAALLPGSGLTPLAAGTVEERLAILREAIERAPKTLRWRTRDRLGRHVRWYRDVEEVL